VGYYAAPSYYAAPGYYAAPSYYAASGYYNYPTAATAGAAPAAAPVAPVSYLASFVPDGQAAAAPGPGGLFDPYSSQARGQAILNGLRSTFAANRGMLFGTLLQTALHLFAQQFFFSPNNQDYGILANLVQKVISEATGSTGSSGVGPGGQQGVTGVPTGAIAPTGALAQGSVLTVSVEAVGADGKLQVVSRVSINLGGPTAGGRSGGIPVAPGSGAGEPGGGVVPPTPPPAGAPPATRDAPKT
jgi:hypothetical protein